MVGKQLEKSLKLCHSSHQKGTGERKTGSTTGQEIHSVTLASRFQENLCAEIHAPFPTRFVENPTGREIFTPIFMTLSSQLHNQS